jgi:hypothetical protein
MKPATGIVLGVAGAMALMGGCAWPSGKQKREELAITDVPAPVRATLERESAGGALTEIERRVAGGSVAYSADIVVKGAAWELTVAEDGAVLSKEREGTGEK